MSIHTTVARLRCPARAQPENAVHGLAAPISIWAKIRIADPKAAARRVLLVFGRRHTRCPAKSTAITDANDNNLCDMWIHARPDLGMRSGPHLSLIHI